MYADPAHGDSHEASPIRDDVVRFLEANEGRGVCPICLGSLFSVTFAEARKLIGALRRRPGFKAESGHCSVCRKVRITVRTTAA
jgi:hypothetical protein